MIRENSSNETRLAAPGLVTHRQRQPSSSSLSWAVPRRGATVALGMEHHPRGSSCIPSLQSSCCPWLPEQWGGSAQAGAALRRCCTQQAAVPPQQYHGRRSCPGSAFVKHFFPRKRSLSQEFVLGLCTQVSELPPCLRWGMLGVLGQLLGELPGLVL